MASSTSLVNYKSNISGLRTEFLNYLESLKPVQMGPYQGHRDFSIRDKMYFSQEMMVINLFEKVIKQAQAKGLSCCKVIHLDWYSHFSSDKIQQILYAEGHNCVIPWIFASIATNASHISPSSHVEHINVCRGKSWEAIYPSFQRFLHNYYGIHCMEKNHTSFVDQYYNAHQNDAKMDKLTWEIRRPNGGNGLYKQEGWHITELVNASELRLNSHEYVLSLKKDWEPRVQPNFSFPKKPASMPLPTMAFLFEDLITKKYTDVQIHCNDSTILHAHRLILIAASSYFKAMLDQNMQESLTGTIKLPFDSKTVNALLKFFYLDQDPFSTEDCDLDEQKLLSLAHLCNSEGLIQYCVAYIGQNTEEKQWKEIGHLGAHYQNKYLLQIYDCYRNRKGKLLSEEMRHALKKYAGMDNLPPPAAKARINFDVGYGNTLGLSCEPFWDEEFPSGFICKKGEWKGYIPINKEFKFVVINSDNTIQWEKRAGNRKLDNPTDQTISFSDVQF